MSNVNQFSLSGIGASVRFGKGNGFVNYNNSTGFEVRNTSNSAFGTLNVATPTAGNHATTKDYVDNLLQGLIVKPEALAATTANITLAGLQVIDGYTITSK